MNKLNKKYQLWAYADNGYHLTEFDDLNNLFDSISEIYTNDFYITEAVEIQITGLTRQVKDKDK